MSRLVESLFVEIELELNGETANTLTKSILPEILNAPSRRTKARISLDRGKLYLCLRSNTTAAMRAAVNSYLGWMVSALETLKMLG